MEFITLHMHYRNDIIDTRTQGYGGRGGGQLRKLSFILPDWKFHYIVRKMVKLVANDMTTIEMAKKIASLKHM